MRSTGTMVTQGGWTMVVALPANRLPRPKALTQVDGGPGMAASPHLASPNQPDAIWFYTDIMST